MIETVRPYLATMLLAAGLFPTLERTWRWRLFAVLPPFVWTYLLVMTLAVAGLWSPTLEIQSAQDTLTALLLPALLFLLMVTCDLRSIFAVGPRVLAVFACAMLTILVGIVAAYLVFRHALPAEGWKMFAALTATWTGGSANLVAVQQSIGLSPSLLPPVLLADALCYSLWVLALFSAGAFAPLFDRWSRARPLPHPEVAMRDASHAADPGTVLLWLGLALAVGLAAKWLAGHMPLSSLLTTASWTVFIATIAGLVVARTPLARLPDPGVIASALLAVLIAVLASRSNFRGLASAPLFVLCGVTALVIHIALFALAARAFRLEFHLCAISSLAQIGGPASAPLLAATYARVLVPIAVLLAMLGLVLGTGVGILMARVLSGLAPEGALP
jgi:uncharacterized membrane protein